MTLPIHILDQLGAVERDNHNVLQKIGRENQMETRPMNKAIQKIVAKHRRMLLSGRGKQCPHIGRNPMPVTVRLHEPGVTLCCWCGLTAAVETAGTVEDRTCDYCRRHDPEGVHAVGVVLGAITFTGGLCDDCYQPDHDHE